MNPLTLVKRINQINSKEAALGISEDASWHAKYKESAYVFVGGIPFDLTEGDLLAVFAQYGEIVDVNLVRDKGTGKSKGFAFVAYEDQRSTNLAVDNLNGASVLGRIIRVDHVTKYKKKEEEDEEEEQRKREERGVCRAFQRGQCNRGAACKFSHNEQRCADTGWGAKDKEPRWGHDKHDGPSRNHKTSGNISDHIPDLQNQEKGPGVKAFDKGKRIPRAEDDEQGRKSIRKRSEVNARDQGREGMGKHPDRFEREQTNKDSDRRVTDKRSGQYNTKPVSKEDHDWRRDERKIRHDSEQSHKEHRDGRLERAGGRDLETKPRKDHDRRGWEGGHDSERVPKDYRDRTGGQKRSRYDRGTSSYRDREENEVQKRRSLK